MRIQDERLCVETRPGEVLHEQSPLSNAPPVVTVESEPFVYQPPAYIYQPADPFRHEIDTVNAQCSIQASHPRWVRRSWFLLFLVLPLCGMMVWLLLVAIIGEWTLLLPLFPSFLWLMIEWLVFWKIWRNSQRKT